MGKAVCVEQLVGPVPQRLGILELVESLDSLFVFDLQQPSGL